jgi:hypothetical protein
MVKRWNSQAGREVAVIQTGIDGYRLIADRTGKLAGISDVEYEEFDDRPRKATVTVKKIVGGQIQEFTATARWSEYVQSKKDGTPNGMWAKMPFLMLGKCAEALALRKAFPADLSGVYTNEEMMQAEDPLPQLPNGGSRPPVQQPQRASDKGRDKPATAKAAGPQPAATQGQEAALEEVSGPILTAKQGKEGTALWLKLANDLLVKVPPEKIMPEMKEKSYFVANATKGTDRTLGIFYIVVDVIECSPVEEGETVQYEGMPEDGVFFPIPEDAAASAKPAEEGKKVLEGLKSSGAVKPAAQVEATANAKEKAWKSHPGHDPAVHISYKQGNLLFTIQNGRELTEEVFKGALEEKFGIKHRYLIPKDKFQEVLDTFDPSFEFHDRKR